MTTSPCPREKSHHAAEGSCGARDPRHSPPTAAALPTGARRRVQWQPALNARRCRSIPRQRCHPPAGAAPALQAAPDPAKGERPPRGRWCDGHGPSAALVAVNSPRAGQPPAGSPGMGAGSRRCEQPGPFRARRGPEQPPAVASGGGGLPDRRTWGSRTALRRDPARQQGRNAAPPALPRRPRPRGAPGPEAALRVAAGERPAGPGPVASWLRLVLIFAVGAADGRRGGNCAEPARGAGGGGGRRPRSAPAPR